MGRLRNIPGAADVIGGSAFVVGTPEKYGGDFSTLFGNDNPLYIEIGMGKGRFLMDMAEKYPDRNFFGIEIYESVLFKAVQKAEVRAMIHAGADPASAKAKPVSVKTGREEPWEGCNFRFLRMDAAGLADVISPSGVYGIYLNFSDPWPKKRHSHRRLTSERFLKLYEKLLAPGAAVEFKTDNRDLFDFSLEELGRCGWKIEECTYDLHNDPEMNAGNIMTEYEEKFSAGGNPICKVTARPGGQI